MSWRSAREYEHLWQFNGEEVKMLDSEVGNKTSDENREMSETEATSGTDGDKEMEDWDKDYACLLSA